MRDSFLKSECDKILRWKSYSRAMDEKRETSAVFWPAWLTLRLTSFQLILNKHENRGQEVWPPSTMKPIWFQYPVLGPFLVWSPINTDLGIGLVTLWMIQKCEAWSPQILGFGLGLQCDSNPNRAQFLIQYHGIRLLGQSNSLFFNTWYWKINPIQ
jgi:hypothetical protein